MRKLVVVVMLLVVCGMVEVQLQSQEKKFPTIAKVEISGMGISADSEEGKNFRLISKDLAIVQLKYDVKFQQFLQLPDVRQLDMQSQALVQQRDAMVAKLRKDRNIPAEWVTSWKDGVPAFDAPPKTEPKK